MDHDLITGKVLTHNEFIQSCNFDLRPYGTTIDALIIHCISLPPNQFGGNYVTQLFTNTLDPLAYPDSEEIGGLRVSSHFYIKRCGKLIQFVSTQYRAWHAGKSNLHGRKHVNDFSIGIELEGCDTQPYELAQYIRLVELTICLRRSYPQICLQNIVGHSQIAPQRKTDPGPFFDWEKYYKLID